MPDLGLWTLAWWVAGCASALLLLLSRAGVAPGKRFFQGESAQPGASRAGRDTEPTRPGLPVGHPETARDSQPVQGHSRAGGALATLSIVAGAVAGQAVLGIWPRWPPASALDRLLCLGLPAAVAWHLLAGPEQARRWRRVVGWPAASGLCWLLLHRSVHLQGSAGGAAAIVAASGLVLASAHVSLVRLWRRTGSLVVPLSLAAALLAAGLLIALAGYIKGGATPLPWSAAVAGVTWGAVATRTRIDLAGAVGLAEVLLFAIAFVGLFFGGLSIGTALGLALGPLGGWVSELPALRHWTSRGKDALRLAIVAAILLGMLAAAGYRFSRHTAPRLGLSRAASGP